jgi:hypothetical protein
MPFHPSAVLTDRVQPEFGLALPQPSGVERGQPQQLLALA